MLSDLLAIFMSEASAARLLREVKTVAAIASRHIEAGSKVYTDNFPSYNVLQSMGYRHETINHSLNPSENS
jgi:hypothetical protein